MTLNEIIMQLVMLEEHPVMPKGFQPTFQKVIEAISEMPEIIRCKDCRFYEFKQGSLPWNNSRRYCNRSISLSTQESDYCSFAELRGDSDGK